MSRKKVWSIVLLCIIAIYIVPMALLCIDMVGSVYEITTVGLSDDALPGASLLLGGAIILSMIGAFWLTSIGIGLSILCRAISVCSTVRIVSTIFICIYSLIMVLDICSAIIFLIALK